MTLFFFLTHFLKNSLQAESCPTSTRIVQNSQNMPSPTEGPLKEHKGTESGSCQQKVSEWYLNRRIAEVGRGLQGHLIHPPCSKKSQLEQVAQHFIQWSFEYLQRWKLHSLSGKIIYYPSSIFFFPYILVEFSVHQFDQNRTVPVGRDLQQSSSPTA